MHGLVADVDRGADRFHDRRGDYVARDGCGGRDPEHQDEHWGDQRGAAHAGQAHHQSGYQPSEG